MAKPLDDILKGVKKSKVDPGSTGKDPGVDYAPKSKGDQDFVAKHKTEKHADRVGNDDDVYKGTTKYTLDDKHGYTKDGSIRVYEETISETSEVHGFSALVSRDKEPNKRVQFHVKTNSVEKGHNIAADYLEKKGYKVHLTQHKGKINPNSAKPVNEDISEAWSKDQLIDYHKGRHERIVSDLMKNPKDKSLKNAADIEHTARTELKKLGVMVKKPKHPSINEKLACNMTEEGQWCPIHENQACSETATNPHSQQNPTTKDDDESAEMAKTQLRALANKAMALAMFLQDNMVVEPWVQSKIAVAKDKITAVHDYMLYNNKKEQAAPMDTPMTFPNMNVDVGATV